MFVLVLCALAVGGLAFIYSGTSHGPLSFLGSASPETAPAQNQAPRVQSLGRIEPEGGVINISVPMGDRLAKIAVTEGQAVGEGAELARLESYGDRLAAKELAVVQLREAKARLVSVEKNFDKQIEEADFKIREIEDVGLLDIKAQQAKVAAIQGQLDSATKTVKLLESLKQGGVPQQELDHKRLAVEQAKLELDSAKALLQKTESGLKYNVQSAKANLETLKATKERTLREIPVDSLQKSLDLADERLKSSILRASVAGTILKILSHPGETVGSVPILKMADTKQMIVVAEVYETDVWRIRRGQQARIESRALPPRGSNSERFLAGKVYQIGTMIAGNKVHDIDPTADADRRVVEVKIQLDQEHCEPAARLINLQVNVMIKVDEGGKE